LAAIISGVEAVAPPALLTDFDCGLAVFEEVAVEAPLAAGALAAGADLVAGGVLGAIAPPLELMLDPADVEAPLAASDLRLFRVFLAVAVPVSLVAAVVGGVAAVD
jgi:hypothetical protein